MARRSTARPNLGFRPEHLEPRSLLASGPVAGADVLEELGQVSKDAAIRGVEVTAPIAAHGAVTFAFDIEAGGDYTLKIRYSGDGLALEAVGPIGRASISPGPPGDSFATLHLTLPSGQYAITASALGGSPAFVDWAVFLDNGVGQAAAQAPGLVGALNTIPLTTGPPAPAPSSSSSSYASASIAIVGPVGRPGPTLPLAVVGPTAGGGSLAMAYAGEALPGRLATVPTPDPAAEAQPPAAGSPGTGTILTLLDESGPDDRTLADSSWLTRIAEFLAPIAKADGPRPAPAWVDVALAALGASGPDADDDPSSTPSDEPIRPGSMPMLLAGLVCGSAIFRRRRPRFPGLGRPGESRLDPIRWPQSMA